MDKLLKLEKYQLLHNSIYWCGMIGIFILGFFTADMVWYISIAFVDKIL